MRQYEHTETGWVIIGSLLASLAGLLAAGALAPALAGNPALAAAAVVLLLALANFYKLTIYVDEEFLGLSMGIGLIRKKFRLGEISSVSELRSSWFSGWGIHYVGGGWLYNVNSLRAVEFKFRDGKRCLLGTDDPQGLAAAVSGRLGTGKKWR